MSLLFRVIYAAHARGTHHKLALDALPLLTGGDADGWRRLLLKYAEPFMVGAKAPDDEFKDFKNHVLHVRDGFWGGAPQTARAWYGKLVDQLKAGAWQEAAYTAGVLSHYVTDPVHPFHTGQTDAENAIHRAFEWSTAKSYDAVKQAAAADPAPAIAVPERPDWLEELLRQAATHSNRHYEKLIAHYDIHRGVVDPPAGLDVVAKRIVGGLVRHASALFALVLGRAIAESGARPPEVALTLDTVLAVLKIPLKTLKNRLADAEDRRQVERIYDELRSTGVVEVNLPEDDRLVRDLHRAEVLRAGVGDAARPSPAPTARAAAGSVPIVPAARKTSRPLDIAEPPKHAPPTVEPVALTARPPSAAPTPLAAAAADSPPESVPASAQPHGLQARLADLATAAAAVTGHAAEAAAREVAAPVLARRDEGKARARLKPADPVVDAPSIGPRMAERLKPLGIETVEDLLSIRAERIAEGLARPGITPAVVAGWQAQARLVCAVPGLTGGGAQLLVGAGYDKLDRIAEAEVEKLCADVLTFAASPEGRRILRDGEPPDIERIKAWADGARQAMAA